MNINREKLRRHLSDFNKDVADGKRNAGDYSEIFDKNIAQNKVSLTLEKRAVLLFDGAVNPEKLKVPLTPYVLIKNMHDKVLTTTDSMYDTDIGIAIWYSHEFALYLVQIGYNNITILAIEENESLRKRCEKHGVDLIIVDLNNETRNEMKKFDLVIGNPPFSKKVITDTETGGKSINIWDKFVKKSIELCKKGGIIALIHPAGWRDIGDPYDIWDVMTDKQIHHVNMYGLKETASMFKVTCKIDIVITENIKKYKETNIIDDYNNEKMINIDEYKFIASSNGINHLLAKKSEECVTLLRDSQYHTQNNGKRIQMNENENEAFKYPCSYTINNSGVMSKWYSNEKKGHFGIPKVIFSNGAASRCTVLDETGKYGLTQFSSGIVDSPEKLKHIKTALESSDFRTLLKEASCGGGHAYDYKIIKLLRKDFWKEFI